MSSKGTRLERQVCTGHILCLRKPTRRPSSRSRVPYGRRKASRSTCRRCLNSLLVGSIGIIWSFSAAQSEGAGPSTRPGADMLGREAREARSRGGGSLATPTSGPKRAADSRERTLVPVSSQCSAEELVQRRNAVANRSRSCPAAYFDAVRNHIARSLAQAQSEGTFRAGLDPENLAVSLTALIQGGYVLARTFRDETLMRRAADGALALISEISRPK